MRSVISAEEMSKGLVFIHATVLKERKRKNRKEPTPRGVPRIIGVLLDAALAETREAADIEARVLAIAGLLVDELGGLATDQGAVDIADLTELDRRTADGCACDRNVPCVDVEVGRDGLEGGEGEGEDGLREGLHGCCGEMEALGLVSWSVITLEENKTGSSESVMWPCLRIDVL